VRGREKKEKGEERSVCLPNLLPPAWPPRKNLEDVLLVLLQRERASAKGGKEGKKGEEKVNACRSDVPQSFLPGDKEQREAERERGRGKNSRCTGASNRLCANKGKCERKKSSAFN